MEDSLMALDRTGFLSALKRKYEPRVAKLLNEEFPATQMLMGGTDLGLEFWSLPVLVSGGQRIANDMPTAVAQTAAGVYRNFLLPTQFDFYGIADISNKILEGGSADKIADTYMIENDGVVTGIYDAIENAIFRDGSGTIGVVSAEPAENAGTFDVILSHRSDSTNFEPGATVEIYSAAFGGSQRDSDGSDNEWVVAAVDHNTGTITLTGTYDSSGDIAADDVIQRQGAHQSAVANAVNFPGLEGWIPDTPGTFFNVDTTEAPTKLAGHRISAGSKTVEEGIIDALAEVDLHKRRPDTVFLNPLRAAILSKEIGSRAINDPTNGKPGYASYKGFMFATGWGMVKVVSAPKCPFYKGFVITNKRTCIELKSIGKLCKHPGLADLNKMGIQLEGTDDNRTIWVSRCALGMKEPFAHAKITWTT